MREDWRRENMRVDEMREGERGREVGRGQESRKRNREGRARIRKGKKENELIGCEKMGIWMKRGEMKRIEDRRTYNSCRNYRFDIQYLYINIFKGRKVSR